MACGAPAARVPAGEAAKKPPTAECLPSTVAAAARRRHLCPDAPNPLNHSSPPHRQRASSPPSPSTPTHVRYSHAGCLPGGLTGSSDRYTTGSSLGGVDLEAIIVGRRAAGDRQLAQQGRRVKRYVFSPGPHVLPSEIDTFLRCRVRSFRFCRLTVEANRAGAAPRPAGKAYEGRL
jgi:hypothetical protein